MNGFLFGPNGERSSTRLVMAIVVVGIVATWSASTIISALKRTPQIQVPWEIVTLGVTAIAGKVANSTLAEEKGSNGPNASA